MIEVAIGLIVKYRKELAQVAVLLLVAFLLYWAFVHNPAVIKAQKDQISQLQDQVKDGQEAADLLQNIAKGKVKIDDAVQSQISSIRKKVFTGHTSHSFMPAGRLPMSPVHKAGSAN